MVAVNIDGLHAHWTGERIFQQRNAKAVGDGDAKVARTEDGVVPVFLRGNRCDKAPSVGLRDATQPLGVRLSD